MSSENDEPKASTSKDENPRAPIFPCRNLQTFTAIEYPGKVEQQSVDKALDTLGGLSRLEEALSTQDETRSVVEMQLAPPKSRGNINFAHPVPAETVVTGNLVLKVTRRKRKKRQNEDGSEPPQPSKGIYTVESAGIVKRTLRFRGQ